MAHYDKQGPMMDQTVDSDVEEHRPFRSGITATTDELESSPLNRQRRTFNLGITAAYCSHWKPTDGIRELIQNFLDGTRNAPGHPDRFRFRHHTIGGLDDSRWKETWVATSEDDELEEYGSVEWDRRNSVLKLKVRTSYPAAEY